MSLLGRPGLLQMAKSEHTAHAGVHLCAEHRAEQTAALLQGRANVRQPVHNAGFLIEVAAHRRVAERAVVVGQGGSLARTVLDRVFPHLASVAYSCWGRVQSQVPYYRTSEILDFVPLFSHHGMPCTATVRLI